MSTEVTKEIINKKNNETYDRVTKILRIETTIAQIVIGFFIGLLVAFIFLVIAYYTRSAVFHAIPKGDGICKMDDFVNDPLEALEKHPHLTSDDLLFVKDGKLYFQRPVKSGACDGRFNIVVVKRPKYCILEEGDYTNLLKKIQDIDDDKAVYKNLITDEKLELSKHCKSDYNTKVTNFWD